MLKTYWMVFALVLVVLLVGAFEGGKRVRSYELELKRVAECAALKDSVERQRLQEMNKLLLRIRANTDAISTLIREDAPMRQYHDLEEMRTRLYESYGFLEGYAQGVMERCKTKTK